MSEYDDGKGVAGAVDIGDSTPGVASRPGPEDTNGLPGLPRPLKKRNAAPPVSPPPPKHRETLNLSRPLAEVDQGIVVTKV